MKSCQCGICQSACTHKPGWFKPGEAEKAAELLGMSLQDFFDKYLAVDFWGDGKERVFLLSPAIKGEKTGGMTPYDPRGECIFYVNGLCGIHDAKPFECAIYMHDTKIDDLRVEHEKVKDLWAKKKWQQQVQKLLGRKPVAPKGKLKSTIGSLFSGLFGEF